MYIQENFLALQFLHSRSPPSPNPPRSVRSKLSPARLRPVTGGRRGSISAGPGVQAGPWSGRVGGPWFRGPAAGGPGVPAVGPGVRCSVSRGRGAACPGGLFPFLSSWVPSLVLQLWPCWFLRFKAIKKPRAHCRGSLGFGVLWRRLNVVLQGLDLVAFYPVGAAGF